MILSAVARIEPSARSRASSTRYAKCGQPTNLQHRSRMSFRSMRATGSLSGKPPNCLKRCINIGVRMVRADLESDLLVALGHDRIVEPGGENALAAQMRDHRGGAR